MTEVYFFAGELLAFGKHIERLETVLENVKDDVVLKILEEFHDARNALEREEQHIQKNKKGYEREAQQWRNKIGITKTVGALYMSVIYGGNIWFNRNALSLVPPAVTLFCVLAIAQKHGIAVLSSLDGPWNKREMETAQWLGGTIDEVHAKMIKYNNCIDSLADKIKNPENKQKVKEYRFDLDFSVQSEIEEVEARQAVPRPNRP